ncbi:MAG: hypothetical protein NTV68_16915 [Methanomicrobiales archaeon]|nr:hypothetical protein [Methanomicrobiales archaeon]
MTKRKHVPHHCTFRGNLEPVKDLSLASLIPNRPAGAPPPVTASLLTPRPLGA